MTGPDVTAVLVILLLLHTHTIRYVELRVRRKGRLRGAISFCGVQLISLSLSLSLAFWFWFVCGVRAQGKGGGGEEAGR